LKIALRVDVSNIINNSELGPYHRNCENQPFGCNKEEKINKTRKKRISRICKVSVNLHVD